MLLAVSFVIPIMILFMTLLSALKLFFHNVRQLSLEEICRAVIYELTTMGCTQIPISTLSHIWVFVRQYGIMFVIIVIIIIIIMIIKSEGVNAQL